MRIISGKLKGKKLKDPIDKETRPLKDVVKESIFNIINHSNKFNLDLEKSNILISCLKWTLLWKVLIIATKMMPGPLKCSKVEPGKSYPRIISNLIKKMTNSNKLINLK